jgi:hypothetical protein
MYYYFTLSSLLCIRNLPRHENYKLELVVKNLSKCGHSLDGEDENAYAILAGIYLGKQRFLDLENERADPRETVRMGCLRN